MNTCLVCGSDAAPDYRLLIAACLLALGEGTRTHAREAEERGAPMELVREAAKQFVSAARAVLDEESGAYEEILPMVLEHARRLSHTDGGQQ